MRRWRQLTSKILPLVAVLVVLCVLSLLIPVSQTLWLETLGISGALHTGAYRDKSSLEFDADYGCQGACDRVSAQVCNVGDGDMREPSAWELYWAASGNPKDGVVIADGAVDRLVVGQCLALSFDPGANPDGPSGNYAFKAYQPPNHPRKGELWSETCEILCSSSSIDSAESPARMV